MNELCLNDKFLNKMKHRLDTVYLAGGRIASDSLSSVLAEQTGKSACLYNL